MRPCAAAPEIPKSPAPRNKSRWNSPDSVDPTTSVMQRMNPFSARGSSRPVRNRRRGLRTDTMLLFVHLSLFPEREHPPPKPRNSFEPRKKLAPAGFFEPAGVFGPNRATSGIEPNHQLERTRRRTSAVWQVGVLSPVVGQRTDAGLVDSRFTSF